MKLALEYKKARKEATCPPETDPAWFFGSCFGSSEEQVNGQVTPETVQWPWPRDEKLLFSLT